MISYFSESSNRDEESQVLTSEGIVRTLGLLRKLVVESERKGMKGVAKAHRSRQRGDLVYTINIKNQFWINGNQRKFEIKTKGNLTIWELKSIIGNNCNVSPELIKFKKQSNFDDIPDS